MLQVRDFLDSWIGSQCPQTRQLRLKIIQQWVAEKIKKDAAASAANGRKKPPGRKPKGAGGGAGAGAGESSEDKPGGASDSGRDDDRQDDDRLDNDGGDGVGGNNDSERNERNGGGDNSGPVDDARDALEGNAHHNGQGQGPAEQPQDRQQGEDNDQNGVEDVVRDDVQADAQGLGGQAEQQQDRQQDNGQSEVAAEELQNKQQGEQQGLHEHRDGRQRDPQQEEAEQRQVQNGQRELQQASNGADDKRVHNPKQHEQKGAQQGSHGYRDDRENSPQQEEEEQRQSQNRQQELQQTSNSHNNQREHDARQVEEEQRQPEDGRRAIQQASHKDRNWGEDDLQPGKDEQHPRNSTSQTSTQEKYSSRSNSISPNADTQDHRPSDTPTHDNRQDPNSQDNLPLNKTSPNPRSNSQQTVTEENTAQDSVHKGNTQKPQHQMQATVEDDDNLIAPQNLQVTSSSATTPDYPLSHAQSIDRAKNVIQYRLSKLSSAPTDHPQTLSQTTLSVQPPAASSILQPTSSSPAVLSKDAQGIQILLTASQLPDPLRLTATAPDRESLFRTLNVLLAMPGNDQLSPARRGDIISFLGSLYDKASYWTLHNNIVRQVERTGLQTERANEFNVDRRSGMASSMMSFDSNRATSVDSRSDSGLKAPPFLTMFAEQWRGFVQFSQRTSTAAVVKQTTMRHEEQCYLHWCTLQVIWKASDPGRDHNNNDNNVDDRDLDSMGVEGDGPFPALSHELGAHLEYADPADARIDSDALLQFLTDQMEQRKSELGLRRSPQHEAHTVGLLKALVAPFLGLTTTENLWRKTMTMGRAVHAVVRELGSGALAVVKRERWVSLTF